VLRIVSSPGGVTSAAKTAVAAVSPLMGVQFRSFSAQLQESVLRER
jgi:hypothetical protein